jgi:hypothetical protein
MATFFIILGVSHIWLSSIGISHILLVFGSLQLMSELPVVESHTVVQRKVFGIIRVLYAGFRHMGLSGPALFLTSMRRDRACDGPQRHPCIDQ